MQILTLKIQLSYVFQSLVKFFDLKTKYCLTPNKLLSKSCPNLVICILLKTSQTLQFCPKVKFISMYIILECFSKMTRQKLNHIFQNFFAIIFQSQVHVKPTLKEIMRWRVGGSKNIAWEAIKDSNRMLTLLPNLGNSHFTAIDIKGHFGHKTMMMKIITAYGKCCTSKSGIDLLPLKKCRSFFFCAFLKGDTMLMRSKETVGKKALIHGKKWPSKHR